MTTAIPMRATRPQARRLTGQAGLTLIDALTALGLFLLATATVGQFVVRQIRTGSTNAMYSVAYSLAAQELEELRGLDYEDIDSRSSTMQEGAMTYQIDTKVIPESPEPNMKEISVYIGWHEPDGAKNVQVQTIFTGIRR